MRCISWAKIIFQVQLNCDRFIWTYIECIGWSSCHFLSPLFKKKKKISRALSILCPLSISPSLFLSFALSLFVSHRWSNDDFSFVGHIGYLVRRRMRIGSKFWYFKTTVVRTKWPQEHKFFWFSPDFLLLWVCSAGVYMFRVTVVASTVCFWYSWCFCLDCCQSAVNCALL